MKIDCYSDYIVERLEILSVITIFATGLVYLKFGLLAACIPGALFHLWAFLGWRRFQKSAIIQPELRNDYVTFDSSGIKVDLNRFLDTDEGKKLVKGSTLNHTPQDK